MNTKPYFPGAAALFLLPLSGILAQAPAPSDYEALTRGPVHEAFAQPFDPNPGPGTPVPKEPPPPIPEKPAEDRPSGDNVQWIGGYWAWDANRNDFVWVSGTYRNAPPGRQYIPGHWVNTADGWQWIPGFWAPDSQTQIPYSDQPPAPLDTAPPLPPPDDNSSYVPGYWYNQDSNFIWRPGYYTAFRPGRIWVSPRYIWTPSGYIFVNGYWDYPLENRGLLFAPVWFSRPWWQTAGWYYRPYYGVGINPLLNSLFWRGNQYYFGNYYGSAYARLGYQPWSGRGYDPLFNYYRWSNRANPNWAAGQRQLYNDRVAGRVATPPNSLAQQTAANRLVAPMSQMTNQNLSKVTASQLTAHNAGILRQQQLSQWRNSNEKGRSVNSAKISGTSLTNGTRSTGTPRLVNQSTGTARVVNSSPRPVVHATNNAVNHNVGRVTSQPIRPAVHTAQVQHHATTAVHHTAGGSAHHASVSRGGGHRGGHR